MKKTRFAMLALHIFVGIGAMAGGSACLLNPTAPLGAPISLLENSPFSDFFIPGLLLFGVIGVGNILSAAAFLTKKRIQPYTGGFSGCALVIWITVQCIMLRVISPLHVIFFVIGAMQCALAALLLVKYNSFVSGLLMKIIPVKAKD